MSGGTDAAGNPCQSGGQPAPALIAVNKKEGSAVTPGRKVWFENRNQRLSHSENDTLMSNVSGTEAVRKKTKSSGWEPPNSLCRLPLGFL